MKRALTTAEAEVKCDVAEGVARDEDLGDGTAVKLGMRNNGSKLLREEKARGKGNLQ